MPFTKGIAQCFVPIFYLLLSFLACHYALHAPNQRLRLYLLPPYVCFAVLSFMYSKNFSLFPSLTCLWAQSVALNVVHITSFLFIEKWPASSQHQQKLSRSTVFYTTYRLWANPQLLPEAAKRKDKNTLEEEPLAVFLVLRLSKLLLYYYLHTHVLPLIFAETVVALSSDDVAQPALLTRLPDVTPREIIIRSYVAVSWIWESLVFLDGANAVLALFAVLSGLDRPADWPSLFGRPTCIRGLHSFWSCFWHRLAVRPYTRYAHLVATCCLGSPQGKSSSTFSSIYNTIVASVVFLLSGLSHAAVSWRLGRRDWLDVKWFLLNFAACLVEKVVLSTVRKLARRTGLERELVEVERSWLGRVVGLVWVFAFFFWSVPLWRFPRLYEDLVRVERWTEILSKMTIVYPGAPDMP